MTTEPGLNRSARGPEQRVVAAALAHGTSFAAISPESAQAFFRARDYRTLAAAGVQTVLELAVIKAGARGSDAVGMDDVILGPAWAVGKAGVQGSRFNAPLLAYMQARARLAREAYRD